MVTPPPAPERRHLTLGDATPWMRRTIGPIAWIVLEVLSEHAHDEGGRTVSCRSVRDIAAELRLADDTVARALRRLADSRLVVHEADRGPEGRFGFGRYVLTLPPNVFVEPVVEAPSSLASPVARRRVSRPVDDQLALLPDL